MKRSKPVYKSDFPDFEEVMFNAFSIAFFVAAMFLAALMIAGCETAQSKAKQRASNPEVAPEGVAVAVYHYQGCEYLKFDRHHYQPAIHSETCPNPKHVSK